ncbi:MAG: electron transfer flavoprotein subunit beta/FixA family protein [Clostridia bacterium]
MNITVCLKQVPNTTEIKIDPITNTLKRDGVESIINPDDKTALEAALQLKDMFGATVNVISMGPPQAEIALREALAMGADNVYLVTDRAFAGSDTLATSTILASAMRYVGYDIIIAGRQAIDGDTAQVGPQIAEHLHLPQVTYVTDIDYNKDENSYTMTRQMEDRVQKVKVKGQVLITVLSSLAKPRYMNVIDIIGQDYKTINILTYNDLQPDKTKIGLDGSPTKVKATFNKQFNGEKKVLTLPAVEAAKQVAELLASKHII